METYVITGELALEFRRWLLQQNHPVFTKRFEDFVVNEKQVSVNKIKTLVSRKFLAGSMMIETRCNQQEVVRARHVAFYFCRKLTRSSLPEIGRYFGNKHHTTVMHGISKITEEIADIPEFAEEMAELEKELTA